jgi:hypothetical protein
LGKFWRIFKWKMLVYFMPIWSVLRPFSISCGHFGLFYGHLVHLSRFGMLYQEKSGNPVHIMYVPT